MAARVDHAGQWLVDHVDWDAGAIPDPSTYQTFARLVAEGLLAPTTAGPAGASTSRIPDEYRRTAAEVCARRALVRALPPSGWLEQVKQYQIKAEMMRARSTMERAERGLPQSPAVPAAAPGRPGPAQGNAGKPRPLSGVPGSTIALDSSNIDAGTISVRIAGPDTGAGTA